MDVYSNPDLNHEEQGQPQANPEDGLYDLLVLGHGVEGVDGNHDGKDGEVGIHLFY